MIGLRQTQQGSTEIKQGDLAMQAHLLRGEDYTCESANFS
jgi:hypothetical protein